MNTGERNLTWADGFVAALAAAGLRRAVLAPGARSSPLALAFLRRPEIACEVVTDERVAAYFALGLAKATGVPAAVVTTSGTAAANLLPAAMEANLAGVPLLLLTADRPPEAQHWGANQTVDQLRLFGSHVRAFHALPTPDAAVSEAYLRAFAARLLEESLSPLPGPVHANVPFREPLLPAAIPAPPPLPSPPAVPRHAAALSDGEIAALAARLSGGRGAILCGELPAAGLALALTRLAGRLGVPLLAEPLANLRFGGHDKANLFARQGAFLGPRFKPDWVLRLGRFPVSRSLERWLDSLAEATHILVAPPGRVPDPLWQSDLLLRCEPEALVAALLEEDLKPAPGGWLASFRETEDRAAAAARRACEGEAAFEGSVAATLLDRLPAGAHCFVGSSLAIRALDAFSGTGGKPLVFHGNRGASGIDGNVATAAGIAAAGGQLTAALIGDQAALHDMGGFAAARGRPLVTVVMNNGGGGIFDHLPFAAAGADWYERGWVAPQGVAFAGVAAAHGLGYRRAATVPELAAALEGAFAAGGPWLVEVAVDRHESRRRFEAYFAALR